MVMSTTPETRVRHCQAVREQLERWGISCKDLADWRGNATLVGLVFCGASGAETEGLLVNAVRAISDRGFSA
jgi:hypothetical protein